MPRRRWSVLTGEHALTLRQNEGESKYLARLEGIPFDSLYVFGLRAARPRGRHQRFLRLKQLLRDKQKNNLFNVLRLNQKTEQGTCCWIPVTPFCLDFLCAIRIKMDTKYRNEVSVLKSLAYFIALATKYSCKSFDSS